MDIKIKAIHNLEKVQFFSINNNLNYLGCEIVCKNGTYSYNYKDKCFNEFVARVIQVYNKEKNNNILLVGELTRKILNSTIPVNDNYLNYKNENNILYTKSISENKLRDYIYLIIISLAKCNNLNNLKIDKLHKLRNKYLITCVEPYMQIPVEIINYDENKIFIDLKFDEIYSCKITFDYDKEQIEAKSTSGKYLFAEFNNNNNYVQINKGNEILYYNEYSNEITDKEKRLLDCYNKIIGYDNGCFTKTIFNNYLSQKETINESNEIKIDKFIINLSNDKINIKYFESLKYKLENIYLPYYNIYHDINIVMIDNEHLLIQDMVDLKYKYTVVEISNINNLFDEFIIKNKYDIDEDIKYKNDIVKLIKSRGN